MTVQARFVATFVDEWIRSGVRHAVVSPGSRSTPLAIACASDSRLTVHMRLDERSAMFFAIGLARSSGTPVVIVTTSGSAAAELHAGVVEADLSFVPVICATADRPIEMHDVRSSQTIDQVNLFGNSTRMSKNFGVAEAATEPWWRSMASQLVVGALSSADGPGPVHANFSFREPLASTDVGVLPPGRPDDQPWHRATVASGPGESVIDELCNEMAGRRGIIIVGEGGCESGDPSDILKLSDALGWPVLADPRAFPRIADSRIVAHADGIYRSEAAHQVLRPQVILRLGNPHLSKSFSTFLWSLRGSEVIDLVVNTYGTFNDNDRSSHFLVGASPEFVAHKCAMQLIAKGVVPVAHGMWRGLFAAADQAVALAVANTLAEYPKISEPGIVQAVFEGASDHSTIVLSASMPIRDLEWFATPREHAPRVIFSSGTNGIDGVISMMAGVAAAEIDAAFSASPVLGIVGDLAFFHDLSGLVWGTLETVPDLTIVVIDNHGGGIFSFLSQADVLDDETYERIMGTPQRPDCAEVARSLGCAVFEADEKTDTQSLLALIAEAQQKKGISVVVVRTERDENKMLHRQLELAVKSAVEESLKASS